MSREEQPRRNPIPPPDSDGGGPDVKTDPVPDREPNDGDGESAAVTDPQED